MIDFGILFSSLVLVFFAELGDKTQLVAFSLTSRGNKPFMIFLASSSALVCSTILAAAIGGAVSTVIPVGVHYISGGLFIFFGCVILFSKEPPVLKQCFLEVILLENNQFKYLPKIFKKTDNFNYHIKNIMRQEQSHAEFFKLLIKEKKLFKDDINEDERLQEIADTLKLKKDILKLPFEKAIEHLIVLEKSGIAFFELINDHLDEEHHSEDSLQETLATFINEEKNHIEFYENLLKEAM